jgi:DNA mismatch endonuclease (patch repair protein)
MDGCFWHGCAIHTKPPRTNAEYWEHKIRGNQLRDVKIDGILADAGWLSIRCWEHEEVGEVARRIYAEVCTRRSTIPRQLREHQLFADFLA